MDSIKNEEWDTPPKITGFADDDKLALLYAELLRKHMPSLSSTDLPQWFEEQGISGYFCWHDNHISFVPGGKDLINYPKQLKETLALFKRKYQLTNFILPDSISQEPDEKALQNLIKNKTSTQPREVVLTQIADELKKENTLTVAALLKADQELFQNAISFIKKNQHSLVFLQCPTFINMNQKLALKLSKHDKAFSSF